MHRRLRTVIRVAAVTLGGLVIVMLGLAALQRRILFPRHLALPYPDAGEGVAGLEKVWIDTPEGKVEGWWLPARGELGRRPAVIFAHGNAELIDYWPEMLEPFRKMGVGVFLPEYRGYGRSAGSPSQEKITEDFVKFYDWLTARPDVDPARIVFHGRSLGGGAVCALAESRKPAAMILQSTFTSVRAVAARFLLPGFLIADPFDNLETIKRLEAPLLVVHGRQDELVPFPHGVRLAEAAKNGRIFATDGDHNSTPPDWGEFFREVKAFLIENNILEHN